MFKNKFLKELDSSNGSALVIVLFLTIGLAALSLLLMNNKKAQTKVATRLDADKEIDVAVAKIGAVLASPANCNATMRGQDLTNATTTFKNLPAIKVCNSGGSCTTGTSSTTLMAPETTTWRLDKSAANFSRVRIKTLQYKIVTNQVGNPVPKPAIARIYVQFEKDTGSKQADGVTKVTTVTPPVSDPGAYTFDVNVVTHLAPTSTTAMVQQAAIVGCSRSLGTTTIY